MGALLYRGMLIGLIAGIVAFSFARLYGEPYVDRAIQFEEQVEQDKAIHNGETVVPEPELVSRQTQSGIGLLVGITIYGAAIGGLFSLCCAFAYGRLGNIGVMHMSLVLAASAFIAVVLIPQLKYPSNPPGVGSPTTIVSRTEDYFLLILISLLAMVLVYICVHKFKNKYGGLNTSIVSAYCYIVFMGIVFMIMPPVNEVPNNFSADVLWHFRLASLGIQAILWSIVGVGFGYSAQRLLKPE